MIEDGRSILAANVRTLPVELSGIMDEEEDIENLFGPNHVRIVLDLHDLGVASVAFFHFFIRRLLLVSSTVAGNDLVNS